MAGILIFAETDEGRLLPGFWEQVAVAQELAPHVEGSLEVVVQGWEIKDVDEARRGGPDRVYVAEDPRLAEPWPDAHLAALTALCRRARPAVVVMPRTLLGTEVAARLAYRLGGKVARDVMSLHPDEGGLAFTRPVFGGAVIASARLDAAPWIVVPRPGAFSPAEPASEPRGQVLPIQPELPPELLKTECKDRVRQTGLTQNLEQAKIIVAGGRGLGGPEPFRLLQEIAGLLDAAVGASRPPCDSGWVEPVLQIGLTGKTVAPELYIAVGISGAIQHMSGCSSSRVIVAINNDPGAPIFHKATYGVVGDWQEVLPALRDALAG
ncbi:MAG: electron transfer flavoprotein subunit alpha/FixB family protein [Anaerolineae bacterium]